jgi:hypothetical protein
LEEVLGVAVTVGRLVSVTITTIGVGVGMGERVDGRYLLRMAIRIVPTTPIIATITSFCMIGEGALFFGDCFTLADWRGLTMAFHFFKSAQQYRVIIMIFN